MSKGIFRRAIAAAAPPFCDIEIRQSRTAGTGKSLCTGIAAKTTLLCIVASLAACGGGGSDGSIIPAAVTSPAPTAAPPALAADQSPTISGTPQAEAPVGVVYRFQPRAGGPKGAALSFRAQNQPQWMALDTVSGVLSGSPQMADVGIYRDIVLSVTDGRVVASLPAFTVEVRAAPTGPYLGTPFAIPGTFDAINFDRGGEGAAYHDTTAFNAGGALRADEGVDIRVSPNALDGNHVVNNFETGEWMSYTIDVAAAGNYVVWSRVSSVFSDSAYHIEINGQNVTGPIAIPNTGNWDSFQWIGGATLSLTAGRQVLTVVADHQYFDLDAITVVTPPPPAPTPPPPPLPPPDPTNVRFSCSFDTLPDCGFLEQAKVPGRASLTNIARDGGTALKLHTEPGDIAVVSSGPMQRDDVYPVWAGSASPIAYGEGTEQWWAHSIYLPDDFQFPRWHSYVLFDFHSTGAASVANFMVNFRRVPGDDLAAGRLQVQGWFGDPFNPTEYYGLVGPPQRDVWYDFVYHVRWSSGADGFFDAWVNGKRVLAHVGPTLFAEQNVYVKLANYHLPICDPYPACAGTDADYPSSVIHDRIVLGDTAQAVSTGPLEGVP